MKSTDLRPNRRILIVDDNTSIHSDFRNILCPDHSDEAAANAMEAVLFDEDKPDEVSFELDSAYQGQEGFEMVKRALAENRPYALAFVDVRMPPGWDGVETIARIWEVDPELQVVVCTAYADYSWEEMRAKVGQPDSLLVLKKPFDNIEVQQLAHGLTKKWLLSFQARLQIAELAQANESLAMSEERFSKAFHESPLPSAIQSFPDQRFVDVNQRLAQVTGHQREEMIGRTPAELCLWERPEVADQWYEALVRHQLVRDQEAKIRNGARRPASRCWCRCPRSPWADSPTCCCWPRTSRSGLCWSANCARPRRWRPSVSWPPAWPTISTTSSRSSRGTPA